MSLQTEYAFRLPKGYVDDDAGLHRDGVMRLARASDELLPLRDPRVKENEAFATVIVLSRVVVQLGTLSRVTPKTIEDLFVSDFAYLQDLYRILNFQDASVLDELEPGTPFPQSLLEVG